MFGTAHTLTGTSVIAIGGIHLRRVAVARSTPGGSGETGGKASLRLVLAQDEDLPRGVRTAPRSSVFALSAESSRKCSLGGSTAALSSPRLFRGFVMSALHLLQRAVRGNECLLSSREKTLAEHATALSWHRVCVAQRVHVDHSTPTVRWIIVTGFLSLSLSLLLTLH